MSEVRIRLRTMSDFWAEDKDLLQRHCPFLELGYSSPIPTQDDVAALALAYVGSHSDDSADSSLTPRSLEKTITPLAQEIGVLWGERLHELPSVTILSSDDYRVEFNRLNAELCAHLGIDTDDAEPICPPSVALFPHQGRLLVSDRSRLPVRSGDPYTILDTPWKQKHLEYCVAEALAISLYAQLRGDWKDPASISLNPLSSSSHYIPLALLSRTTEVLARTSHPDWALEVVHDHVVNFYCHTDAFPVYRYVDMYLRSFGKSFAQLAMVCDFTFDPQKGELGVVFMPKHPFHEMRVRYFKEGRE